MPEGYPPGVTNPRVPMRSPTTPRPRPVLPVLLLGAIACTEPTAPARGGPEAAVTTTAAITFRSINAGGVHTCGVATDNRAYCWGGRPQPAIPTLRFLDVR